MAEETLFKYFKTFIKVYELGSFSKAATELYVSQPTVTLHINFLEEQLDGARLFERKGRQEVVATAQGEIFYYEALKMLQNWQNIRQQMEDIASQQIKTCQIGASQTFANTQLPGLLAYLIRKFPDITFDVMIDNSENILELVEKYVLDFGFIEKPLKSEQLSRVSLGSDQLVLAGDMASDLWLVREQKSGIFYYTNLYLQEKNISPYKKMNINHNPLIVSLLKKQIGKSIISEDLAKKEAIPYKNIGSHFLRRFYLIQQRESSKGYLDQVKDKIIAFWT